MLEMPEPGLYRTTQAYPGNEDAYPVGVLVFVGQTANNGGTFVVRPGANRRNRWFWGEPTTPLRSPTWGKSLKKLPSEGFYTLPRNIEFEGGGRWLKDAIIQLGYNEKGEGIVFVAEWGEDSEENVLRFSERGVIIADDLLSQLKWAPILPVQTQAIAH